VQPPGGATPSAAFANIREARYGINQKTVAKWKQRETVADLPTDPKRATSTLLSIEEEARLPEIEASRPRSYHGAGKRTACRSATSAFSPG
jgi:hypothetical protein